MQEDYVLSIYGTKLDPNSSFGKQQKSMRESSGSRKTRGKDLEERLKKLIDEKKYPNGFWIYIHKTNADKIGLILGRGLEIREPGGGLGSTMARAFDSKSEDLEGDFNYLFNSIFNGNQYGSDSILAIFPRDEGTIASSIIKSNGNYPCIPPEYIIASSRNGYIIPSQKYVENLENGQLITDAKHISTQKIGSTTIHSSTENKNGVDETFEQWKKRMIEKGILRE